MIKNVVEKAVVPYNPSSNKIINKDKYNLFAPMATKDLKGIASFDENDFNVLSGKVSLKYNKDRILEEGDQRYFKLTKLNLFSGSLDDLKTPGSYCVEDDVVFVIYNSRYDVYFQYHISANGDMSMRHTNTVEKSWTSWSKLAFDSSVDDLGKDVAALTERLNALIISSKQEIFLLVETLPEIGETNKIYLVRITDGKDPNLFDEFIWAGNRWEYLGQSGLNIDLTDYVKFTDIANTNGKPGVVMTNMGKGIFNDKGVLYIVMAENEWIKARTSRFYPIVPANLDFAVKDGIVNNGIELTDYTLGTDDEGKNTVTDVGEKITACNWLGALPRIFVDTSPQKRTNCPRVWANICDKNGKISTQEISVSFWDTPVAETLALRGREGHLPLPNTVPKYDTDATPMFFIKNLPDYLPLGDGDKYDENGKQTQWDKAKWLNWLGAVGYNNYPIPGESNDKATAGVVKVRNYGYYGLEVNANGFLKVTKASDADIKNRSNSYTPITPNNLNLAVKEGITNNPIELTKEEQQSACNWLGVGKQIVLADLVTILTTQNHATFISLSERMVAGDCVILARYYQADATPIYAVPTIEGGDGVYRWRLTLATSLTTVFIVEVIGDGVTLTYNQAAYDHTNFIAKNSTEEWTFTLEDGSTITKKVAVVAAEA